MPVDYKIVSAACNPKYFSVQKIENKGDAPLYWNGSRDRWIPELADATAWAIVYNAQSVLNRLKRAKEEPVLTDDNLLGFFKAYPDSNGRSNVVFCSVIQRSAKHVVAKVYLTDEGIIVIKNVKTVDEAVKG